MFCVFCGACVKHGAAAARAQNAVQSTRFGALTLDIAAWLQAGHWITPQDDLVRDPGDLPITIFRRRAIDAAVAAVDKERLAAIGIRRGSKPNRACAAGLLSEREDMRVEAAMAVATEAYAELAKVKPFWR